MMAVMISAGTPYSASARCNASAWRCQNSAPPSMRARWMKIGRYWYQGLPSAGRVIASMMSWRNSTCLNQASSCARSKPLRCTISAMKAATSARRSRGAAAGGAGGCTAGGGAALAGAGLGAGARAVGGEAQAASNKADNAGIRIRCMRLPASARQQSAVSVNGHEDTETGHDGHQRRAAVAHQRQRHAHDRQEAGDHADVDEHVHEEGEGDAARHQPRVTGLRLRRDIKPAADDEEINRDQQQNAQQHELFSQHRENEIGGPFRLKIEMGLGAVEPALAVDAAGANGYLRLIDVIAGAERIILRIQKCDDTLALIIAQEIPQHRRRGRAQRAHQRH